MCPIEIKRSLGARVALLTLFLAEDSHKKREEKDSKGSGSGAKDEFNKGRANRLREKSIISDGYKHYDLEFNTVGTPYESVFEHFYDAYDRLAPADVQRLSSDMSDAMASELAMMARVYKTTNYSQMSRYATHFFSVNQY